MSFYHPQITRIKIYELGKQEGRKRDIGSAFETRSALPVAALPSISEIPFLDSCFLG
jgi:hypothetical protein